MATTNSINTIAINNTSIRPQKLISETKTVKTSGGDFTTIQAAIDYAQTYKWAAGTYCTIEIDDGIWTITSDLLIQHPDFNMIRMVGKNSYAKSVTGISGTPSGATTNWTYVLTLNNVTNITTNDYVIIYGATGGTRPTYINGCYRVTAVGGSTITIHSTHFAADFPSGAVSASLNVIKTSIYKSNDGGTIIHAYTDVSLDKLVTVGNAERLGSAAQGIVFEGPFSSGGISPILWPTNTVGAVKCSYGFLVLGANRYIRGISTGACNVGVEAAQCAYMDLNGCNHGGNAIGISVAYNSCAVYYGAWCVTGCVTGIQSISASYQQIATAANITGCSIATNITVNAVDAATAAYIKQ